MIWQRSRTLMSNKQFDQRSAVKASSLRCVWDNIWNTVKPSARSICLETHLISSLSSSWDRHILPLLSWSSSLHHLFTFTLSKPWLHSVFWSLHLYVCVCRTRDGRCTYTQIHNTIIFTLHISVYHDGNSHSYYVPCESFGITEQPNY